MADRYYGVEFGAKMDTAVTEGSSSTAARDVELRVTYDATGASKLAVLNAIDVLRAKIVAEPFPLA